MARSLYRLILTAHLLCAAPGCHTMDYHRRPPSDDQPDPNYGMTALPVGNSFVNRFVPNYFLDCLDEAAQIAQSADR